MLPSSPVTLNGQAEGLSTAPMGDTDAQDQSALLQAFLATVQHFFGGFVQMFAPITDPRRPEFIVYPLAALLFAGVLMYACRLGARRQIGHLFRANGASASKFQALFQVETCPHGDTLDAAFSRLNPAEAQEVVTSLTETLIRCKVLYPYRLLGRYFPIVMDGTASPDFAGKVTADRPSTIPRFWKPSS